MPVVKVKKLFYIILLSVILILIGIQVIPVNRENPAVKVNVAWDSERTKELFYRGCADCHSNETKWPWYSKVAPASWLVAADVEKGRRHLNISEEEDIESDEMTEEIRKGEMPFKPYLFMHPEARFTEQEKNELINGLEKTFTSKSNPAELGSDEDD